MATTETPAKKDLKDVAGLQEFRGKPEIRENLDLMDFQDKTVSMVYKVKKDHVDLQVSWVTRENKD